MTSRVTISLSFVETDGDAPVADVKSLLQTRATDLTIKISCCVCVTR
jgi:hypothetical protein